MKKVRAVYAGSFDPPTNGHLHIINKARHGFDELVILIADNPAKSPDFTVDERVEMLTEIAKNCHWGNVSIHVLPTHQYTVLYAREIGARFLIRGLRNGIDFAYENAIYETNLKICPEVETLFLMANSKLANVSSSTVKGLVGMAHWYSVVTPYVPANVLNCLLVWYLRKRFCNLIRSAPFGASLQVAEKLWAEVKTSYTEPSRHYHNLHHISSCLETMDVCRVQSPPVEFALWYHDIADDEAKSAKIAAKALGLMRKGSVSVPVGFKNKIVNLILSTKHAASVDGRTAEEDIIASIDLAILGRDGFWYQQYQYDIYEEYYAKSGAKDRASFNKQWVKGRRKVVEMFLRRKCIYPWATMEIKFGEQARFNLGIELHRLKKGDPT